MLELIILIILIIKIRKIAAKKGLSKTQWTFKTIFFWIAGEFIFLFLGMLVLGTDFIETEKVWLIVPIGLTGGLLGYWLILYSLNNTPEQPLPPPPEEKDLSYFR